MGFEDTFKKQLDETGKALVQLLTGLLGLKSEGKEEEGLAFVKQTLSAKTHLDFNEIISIPKEQLADFVIIKHKLNEENIDKLAAILFELAEGTELSDRINSVNFFERSLVLHEFLSQVETTYSLERQYKIEEIREALK